MDLVLLLNLTKVPDLFSIITKNKILVIGVAILIYVAGVINSRNAGVMAY